jgi:uncharacterized OsmC-like protein
MTEMNVEYTGNMICEAIHTPSGIKVISDIPQDIGGNDTSFSSTDFVAFGLASCILTTLAIVAERSGLDLSGMKAHVKKELTKKPVRRIGEMSLIITFPEGKPVPEKYRRRLERASGMCPVKNSLHPDVKLFLDFVYPE